MLFALCICSVSTRCYIRFHIQKQFSLDDGILLFGVACLAAAIGLLMAFIDRMYVVSASESGDFPNTPIPADFAEQSYSFQKLVDVALVLTWFSIVSVKFSYLFLFRRLISRIPQLVTYWWIAAVFNGVISIYGSIVYGVVCRDFYSVKASKTCPTDFTWIQ